MANVLPPEKQKTVRSHFRMRMLFAFSVVAIVCGSIFFIALLPSYITLTISGGKLASPAAAATSSSGTFLRDTKDLLSQLRPLLHSTTTPSESVAVIVGLRPKNVRIDRITYSAGEQAKVVVVGTAASSTAIEAFRAALAKDPHFSIAAIPVNVLVGSGNGSFTINLTGL